MVSKASCAPPNNGRPSATTSRRRPLWTSGALKSKSLTVTLVDTLAPPSRHTLAAALSRGKPRLPNTPALAHAARWWPSTSVRRPHRRVRETRGRGNRRRCRSNTLYRTREVAEPIQLLDRSDTVHQSGHDPPLAVLPFHRDKCYPCLAVPGSKSSGPASVGERPGTEHATKGQIFQRQSVVCLRCELRTKQVCG